MKEKQDFSAAELEEEAGMGWWRRGEGRKRDRLESREYSEVQSGEHSCCTTVSSSATSHDSCSS
jgi:hypothetical protein